MMIHQVVDRIVGHERNTERSEVVTKGTGNRTTQSRQETGFQTSSDVHLSSSRPLDHAY